MSDNAQQKSHNSRSLLKSKYRGSIVVMRSSMLTSVRLNNIRSNMKAFVFEISARMLSAGQDF